MLITAIRQTSPGRLTVCLEDGTALKSTLSAVTDLRLYSGRELDREELEALRLSSARSLAREKALELLSRRPMSRQELKTKLLQKGEDEETAEFCAAWLCDNGLLDDESYAAAVTRHYAAKGYGPGRIRSELSRRGVDRKLRESALEQMPDNSAKLDKFIAARLKDPTDRDQLRKVTAALYRRGHSWEEIRAALRRFDAEPEEY